MAALGEGRPGLPDPATLESLVLPSVHDSQRAPGLRFGDPRTMALLGSVTAFAHVIGGLTNKSLRTQMAAHWREEYSSAQASYDLRRLRLKGLIERIEGTRTPIASRLTACALVVFFTQLADRVIVPALTDLADLTRPSPPAPRPLTAAWRTYERELDLHVRRAWRNRAGFESKTCLTCSESECQVGLEEITESTRGAGMLRHRFVSGDGELVVIDEWEAAEQFQSFFDGNPKVAEVMASVGMTGPPEITVFGSIDAPGTV